METLFGLLVLIADIYAIVKILQSREDGLKKAIWILVVVLFPILGLILWWFLGPKP